MGKTHPSIGAGYRTPLISDVDRLLSASSNVRNGSDQRPSLTVPAREFIFGIIADFQQLASGMRSRGRSVSTGLLRAIDSYDGSNVVRHALRLAPMVFVRPGELRAAEWKEFNLDAGEWRIGAERMKMRVQHIVALVRGGVHVNRLEID